MGLASICTAGQRTLVGIIHPRLFFHLCQHCSVLFLKKNVHGLLFFCQSSACKVNTVETAVMYLLSCSNLLEYSLQKMIVSKKITFRWILSNNLIHRYVRTYTHYEKDFPKCLMLGALPLWLVTKFRTKSGLPKIRERPLLSIRLLITLIFLIF